MDVKIYKAFIASPSDTNSEREICDKIFEEINAGLGNIFNFRIESLKWEKDVRPTIKDTDGQTEIFNQIGDDFEIFIGIMNKKFGSPTPRAGSGTEEEFNAAFNRYQIKQDIEVIFYFNDEPPISMSDLNLTELGKIAEFKKKIQPIGIYGIYNGVSDFEEKLRKNLSKFFSEQYKKKSNESFNAEQIINKEALKKVFKKRFNDSLRGFDDQPQVWIEPVLSRSNAISQNPDENFSQRVLIEEILLSEKSYIINAPSQFGLTTLAHHLVLEAWDNDELWIYIDNSSCKPHHIPNAVKNEVSSLEQNIEDVKCVIFDSFNSKDRVSFKKLKRLIEVHPDYKFIVLNTADESLYLVQEDDELSDDENLDIDKVFEQLHLIALPRTQIRKLVCQYNSEKKITDNDKLLNKVTTDLECLNLHRTPYNVITLLKVSEKYFDDSPINRTRVIEMILFVLFDLGEIPKYKTKPDLKDTEYVLGKYCEIMLKKQQYNFRKDDFISNLKVFCEEKLIELDIEVVFEILTNNNIIVPFFDKYRFKSSFWIYYFGAKRMHVDKSFRDYIFESKKYSAFPEIIEFYTGIDRNRDDALEILLRDIRETKTQVEEKLGIKGEINPLNNAKWKPKENEIEKLQEEIGENVLTSKLPDTIKDQYIDKEYNQIRPYNQSIQKFFEEYSLHNLIQQIRAASTALRNSDYADSQLKKDLIDEIYGSWNQLAKVLFAISPIMATNGHASFEGAGFQLSGDFGNTFEEKLTSILQVLPTNVVGYFQDELYSPKIAPLLYDSFNKESNELLKHQQALLLIFKRPNGWKSHIEKYITSIHKNSYYLFDTVNSLRTKYRYDFASKEELQDIKYLIKLGLAKHEFGGSKPGLHQIIKITDSCIPKREFEE
ncbi:hypothetical protein MODO_1122 [Myroides odoratimimus]|uniref:hypothetical protein n=1 Tax=Myroides odoratimimus TaxID=76832 RepID=UPI000726F9F3|nr:hypothetical protein [Myroides odoratimimus]GAQ13467.1 hypothetical protein MODO_1122 [Myroides odoratimimus]STZ48044.1 Uncharacterised protein [Myroides odoratimimus]